MAGLSPKDRVKFAVIGCGRIAYRHMEAIAANPRAKLVALCDLDLARARERAAGANVSIYRDYRTMFAKEDIDVVCIMTPSGMHAEHATDIVARYRKHVVVEKPIALSVVDGERLIETAQRQGVLVFSVHQNRFNKAVQKIKSAIDARAFGKIVMGTVRIRWSRGQSYYDRDPWRGTWALDGGALTNQSIHHIDLLQWLVGDVEAVSAVAATQLVDVEVEDTACAWLKFKCGAIGAIEATTATRPLNRDLEASISILGEKGTVIIEGASVNRLTMWTFGDINLEEYSENPPNVYGYGHNYIIDNVVDVLSGEGKPLIDGQEGLRPVRLLNALYASIETGGKVVQMDNNPVSARLGRFDEKGQRLADLYRTHLVVDGAVAS